MTTRIIKIEKGLTVWYEVQVLVLGLFWIPGDVFRQGFPSYFLSLDNAMESLDKLKKTKTKKTIITKVKI
jgi:hypothetical protein